MSLRVFTESQSLSRLINETIYEYAANKWFIKNTTTPVKDYDILRHVIISEDSTSWFNKNNQLAEDLAMSVYK
ncbi:hypothetical protein ROZALSC1DRAFT_28724 [Rozella allomycis CSF55]|uniref:Uncharacterized protein n=1 Tax=Rozella allomycis (strain CSF55) TaxID=988480 RepID=A0A075AU20_ROZAC|nr:hypothetical protein O9G_004862 [Rozella allomycis CSF55]RKP19706.1 hypothetical protein ROZALSC1DRAFT_28724 [Rozella allomycis CSF55]|eukprot:EPZ32032.1 hypothetical protein O9G_004862 [Rozella allomycis CSF55]